MVTLFVAGHETTATALAWTITRVHEYGDVVAAAKKELDEVLAGGEPEQSKLESLRYLDATVRETLRLNPVVPDVGRLVSRPIRIGGYELPAGVILVPSIDLTHRNPRVWPEPEKFRPERFLERRPGPYEFFPFGGGIRRCIGMSFALFETKVVLARVLSRCDLRLVPGQTPDEAQSDHDSAIAGCPGRDGSVPRSLAAAARCDSERYISRLLRLAALTPEVVESIVEGRGKSFLQPLAQGGRRARMRGLQAARQMLEQPAGALGSRVA